MARLKKFNKNEKEKVKKFTFLGVLCLTIAVITATISYAVYQTEAEVTFINAKVGNFKANDIELAIKLDGEEVDTPPEKNSLYTVTVDCDNATGTWDMEEWGPNIRNITSGKVICEVNFNTPAPTLSDVTATSDKTSISLSYTSGGIGTSTTCKYGKEEGNYPNIIEGATNTNCNISGLDLGTIYYYQVCATNSAGEVCKDGSIKTKLLADVVEIGDYISMTPTSTSYTISKSLTGYSSDQTINPSELNLWRVIKKNEDGTVEMVSEYISSTRVYFQGINGYINFVGGLNTIAAQYTNEKYVQSTRHIGYSNQTETITNTSKLEQTTVPWTKSTSIGTQWAGCSSTDYLCGSDEADGAGDIGYETDYDLVNGALGTMVGKTKSGTASEYWLASRLFSYQTNWKYDGRWVSDKGQIYTNNVLCYWTGARYMNNSKADAVRPIVVLKSTVEIASGAGTKTSTYKLA